MYKKLFPDSPAGVDTGEGRWTVSPRLLQWAMIGAAVLAVGCVVMIILTRKRDAKKQAASPAAVAAAVDVRDENVSAAELAEDAWLRMADELAARGEYRLAMRAVHLAGLRYLGEKGWVTLQPAKTGMEYGRELRRRLRDVAPALEGYGRGLRQYEGVWYGFGEAEAAGYATLRMTWEEMRRHA